jgi:hypothetical protein
VDDTFFLPADAVTPARCSLSLCLPHQAFVLTLAHVGR